MIKGFDKSHWDAINWYKISADFKFVFLKASQGLTYHDPAFQADWKAARDIGLVHGGYHFWVAQADAKAQANNYLDRGIDWSLPGVLPPVVDIENQVGNTNSQSAQMDKYILNNKSECRDNALHLLELIEAGAGRTPVIYCSPNFLSEYLGDSVAFAKYDLWIAGYQDNVPHLPKGFTNWLFWQNSEYGTAQGNLTGGHLDLDYFNGTQEQLNLLANIK